jgi:hypothetical protein
MLAETIQKKFASDLQAKVGSSCYNMKSVEIFNADNQVVKTK